MEGTHRLEFRLYSISLWVLGLGVRLGHRWGFEVMLTELVWLVWMGVAQLVVVKLLDHWQRSAQRPFRSCHPNSFPVWLAPLHSLVIWQNKASSSGFVKKLEPLSINRTRVSTSIPQLPTQNRWFRLRSVVVRQDPWGFSDQLESQSRTSLRLIWVWMDWFLNL